MAAGPNGSNTVGVAPPQQLIQGGTGVSGPTNPEPISTVQQSSNDGLAQNLQGQAQPFQQNGTIQNDEDGNLIRLMQQGGPAPTTVSREQVNATRDFSGTGGFSPPEFANRIRDTVGNGGFGFGGSTSGLQPGGVPQQTQGGMFGQQGLLNDELQRPNRVILRGLIR